MPLKPLKQDFSYFLNDKTQVNFGGQYEWYTFNPAEITPIEGSNVTPTTLDEKRSTELSSYIDIEQNFGKFTFRYGLRYSLFTRRGAQPIREYAQ